MSRPENRSRLSIRRAREAAAKAEARAILAPDHLGLTGITAPRHTDRQKCSSCGKPFTAHLGLQGTCRQKENARGALKVLHTWLTFRGGAEWDDMDAVRLIEKTLKETE